MVSKSQPKIASIICRMAEHAPQDSEQSLVLLLDAVSESVWADSYAVVKTSAAKDDFQIVAHKGIRACREGDMNSVEAPRMVREMDRRREEPVIRLDGPFTDDPFLQSEGAASVLMVTGDIEGDVLATIAVRRQGPVFDEIEVEAFAAAAHFLNLLGKCWHLKGDLRFRMGQDPLTGFMLYTGFHEVLTREISRARRGERVVSLGLMEVEGWEDSRMKTGAEDADRVLKSIAIFLRDRFRDFDTLARFSPSGFSFVLPDLDTELGVKVLSRVVGELSRHLLEDPDTASLIPRAALASYPENATTTEKLLENAEAALLKAVENRSPEVVVWEE